MKEIQNIPPSPKQGNEQKTPNIFISYKKRGKSNKKRKKKNAPMANLLL